MRAIGQDADALQGHADVAALIMRLMHAGRAEGCTCPADGATSITQLETALAQAESSSATAGAAHAAAMAGRDAELQQLRGAAAHAQELLADVQASYASLQDRHRDLVHEREVGPGLRVAQLCMPHP